MTRRNRLIVLLVLIGLLGVTPSTVVLADDLSADVSGTVKLDGSPLEGVEVALVTHDGVEISDRDFQCTGEGGSFDFTNVPNHAGWTFAVFTGPGVEGGCDNEKFFDPDATPGHPLVSRPLMPFQPLSDGQVVNLDNEEVDRLPDAHRGILAHARQAISACFDKLDPTVTQDHLDDYRELVDKFADRYSGDELALLNNFGLTLDFITGAGACDPPPFVCPDPLGCVSYAENEPIRLAAALVLDGPIAFLGVDEFRSALLAVQGSEVGGHGVELLPMDTGCSPMTAGPVADAIVADPSISAIVGTSCSGAASVMAPIISDAGYSIVSPSNTATFLTTPEEHADGYLRVAWNDRDQGVAMAGYVYNHGATTSAVIAGPGPDGLGEAFVEAFESLTGTNLAFEFIDDGYGNADDVLDSVIAAGVPDVLYIPLFDTDPGNSIVTLIRQRPELDGTQIAAFDLLATQEYVDNVGADAEGMLFTVLDDSFTATAGYETFFDAYVAEYGSEPLQFGPFAYDAADVILSAIEEVAVEGDNGSLHIGRQALRDALFETSGFNGLTGSITCDMLGECGAAGFQILTVDTGDLVSAP